MLTPVIKINKNLFKKTKTKIIQNYFRLHKKYFSIKIQSTEYTGDK